MVQAVTFAITSGAVGTVAVMILSAVVCGIVVYAICGMLIFMGIDNGSKLSSAIATLLGVLTVAGGAVGAYLGYLLMQG